MNIENNQAVTGSGFLEKTKLQAQSLAQKYNIDINKLVEIASYFAVGFFAGILIKRFGRIFVFSVIILVLALFVFENFNIIQIDWLKIKDLTGISPQETVGSLTTVYYEWIKTHLAIVISSLVGLGLGYRVG